eukprot:s207_g32.t1
MLSDSRPPGSEQGAKRGGAMSGCRATARCIFSVSSWQMAAHVRLARRRAQHAAALTRSANIETLMRCQSVQKLDVDHLDASQGPGFTRKLGPLSQVKLGRAELKRTSKTKASNQTPKQFGAAELVPFVDGVETQNKDFRMLCRRLRKLPLRQLAPSLPALHAKISETLAPPAVSHFWSSISRRVLVNSADFPLLSLAYVLPELQRNGHLAKVSALGKLVRGLARQTSALKFNENNDTNDEKEMAFRALLPLLRCCEVLHLQLAASKPRAEGYWAGRLHRMLTRGLPPVLAKAPPSLVIPWLEFYAKNGLVDHDHLHVWEEAGNSIRDALLSHGDEDRITKLQDQVPLWIADCLPQVAPRPSALATLPSDGWTDQMDVEVIVGQGELQEANFPRAPPFLSPPMYQKSPPVPVLWHTSPETYQRGMSRLGARQLILALRYVAADGAGTLATTRDDLPAQKAMVELATGSWPRRHRSRTKAQAFVAELLTQLMSRIGGIRSGEACSAVKSLASLKRIGLANSPEAGDALQALLSGPLAGWKVVTSMTPSDVALLLEGMAFLVADGKGSGTKDGNQSQVQVQAVARASMECATPELLDLAACALQEAGAPPAKLRSMCGAASLLFTWHQGAEGTNSVQAQHSRNAMQRFLNAAAAAVRDGPHTKEPQLVQPLTLLRAAGEAGAWSSDVFAHLAPMVTELILGRQIPRLPGYARDWRPLLPRPGYTRSGWKIEELAETAWLYAQSSSRRPLEGQTALALSLSLLVHLPILQEGLRARSGLCREASRRHFPDLGDAAQRRLDIESGESGKPGHVGEVQDTSSVDSRLLMFASDASRILRSSAEVLYFQSWSSPKSYPRKSHESRQLQLTSIQNFDPQLAKDSAVAREVVVKWKRLLKLLDLSGASLGARRRVRALSERKEAEVLGTNVLAAYAALDLFECLSDVRSLTGPAKSGLLRTYGQQSLARESVQARSQLRLCLRQLHTLKRKQLLQKDTRGKRVFREHHRLWMRRLLWISEAAISKKI